MPRGASSRILSRSPFLPSTLLRLAALSLVLLAPAAARAQLPAVEPANPDSCDELTLIIERPFSADCVRFAEAKLRVDGLLVDVALTIIDTLAPCLDVEVVERFEVPLGRLPAGRYVLSISWVDLPDDRPAVLPLDIAGGVCGGALGFLRSDANADGSVDIGDAVTILNVLFTGQGKLDCELAADVDGRDAINLTDAVYLLNYLFLGGLPPGPPFPECGAATAVDPALSCETPQCIVDPPPTSVWLGRADGCFQCVECASPEIDQVVADLVLQGIDVLESQYFFVPVCLACEICSTGRFYAIRVSDADALILIPLGWGPIPEPPSDRN